MPNIFQKFARRKVVDRDETSTELHRVLSTLDLTMLGIGSTLGIGVYVLAGSVAKESAGPAVVLSFLVAAIASVLAGLCYAEFGARVPKAGSAYVYSYVCVGELIAFIVGWNLIMEYVIGVASVAKGYSGYVDQMFNHSLSTAFASYVPLHIRFLSDYFDAFAFAITLVLTLLLAFGVKESSFFNNIFTVLNLIVVLFVIIAGSFYANPENWALSKEFIINTTQGMNVTNIGEGGFAPFGFQGVMKGAATCFYGFVGFDCIATTGEEAKNPQRAIPLAIIFSLCFIFLAYFGISTVITMMVPYYLQNAEAPLPQAFANVDFSIGKWVVTIGALFGLSTSLLGAMFPMPRVIYAMAKDGVLFTFLSKVHKRFQTPVVATLLAGTFGGLMAALFQLDALIDMMSIGTLTAYTLVAVCVLCLRYRKDVDGADDVDEETTPSKFNDEGSNFVNYFKQIWNYKKSELPTELSSSYVNLAVSAYCLATIAFCAVAIFGEEGIINGSLIFIVPLGITLFAMGFILFSLSLQPVSRVMLTFRVPLVPLLPGVSIMFNTYLIMKLSAMTWVRFAVWMAVGFLIYAICLLNGTTDKSYQKSLDKKKRKYSKVSASGFVNQGLDLSSERPQPDGSSGSNGNLSAPQKSRNGSIRTIALDDLSTQKDPNQNSSKYLEENFSNQKLTNNLDNTEAKGSEGGHFEENIKDAEKAAVEAIDSVISQALVQASTHEDASAVRLNVTHLEVKMESKRDSVSNQSDIATMNFSEGSDSEESLEGYRRSKETADNKANNNLESAKLKLSEEKKDDLTKEGG